MKTYQVAILCVVALACVWLFTHHAEPAATPAIQTQVNPIDRRAALAGAFATSQHIKAVHDALPNGSATRRQLNGLQTLLFAGDYVMASKTNANVTLTHEDLLTEYEAAGGDPAKMQDRLATYADFSFNGVSESLPEHYDQISANPQIKPEVTAVRAAMTESGVTIDKTSDLLMDCIRLAGLNTEFRDIYGPKSDMASPSELNECMTAVINVFQYRFQNRYGLSEQSALQLTQRVGNVAVSNLSPADVEIPAHFR